MEANIMNNVKVYANEFVATIMEENEQSSSGYEWQISYYRDSDEDGGVLNTKALLSLYDGDGVEVGSIIYDIVKTESRCTDTTTFLFEDVIIGDDETEEFEEIKKAIDMCEEGLYDKICAYLHKCAMEQMYNEDDLDYGWPPAYEDLMNNN